MDFSKKISIFLLGIALLFGAYSAFAADNAAIVGYWQTIDQKTNNPSTLIHIYETNGKYFGKIVKIYPGDGRDPTKRCVKCKGKLRNQPVVGMVMISDMVKKGDKYVDGKITDPRSGQQYNCEITLSDDGKKLNVRGYLGFSLLGKTSVWVRAPESEQQGQQTQPSDQGQQTQSQQSGGM